MLRHARWNHDCLFSLAGRCMRNREIGNTQNLPLAKRGLDYCFEVIRRSAIFSSPDESVSYDKA